MTFLEFIQQVESYLRLTEVEYVRDNLKDFINDAILEFTRFWEWRYTKTAFDFTTGKTFDIYDIDSVTNSFIISGNNAFKYKNGDTITISGTIADDGDFTVSGTPTYSSSTGLSSIVVSGSLTATAFAIIGVDESAETFTIDGDYLTKFPNGETFTVAGSDNGTNDGTWTVSGTTLVGGDTVITVAEDITGTVVDGTITAPQQDDGSLTSEHEDYGIPVDLVTEGDLYTAAGVQITRMDYENYLESSANIYALLGTRLYLAGVDTDYKLMYYSRDIVLTDDDDESNVLDYYSDAIKQWTVYKYFIWVGDDGTAAREEVLLKNDITLLKNNENRSNKGGRPVRISAYKRT